MPSDTPLLSEAYRYLKSQLQNSGIAAYEQEARWMIEERLGPSFFNHRGGHDSPLDMRAWQYLQEDLQKRIAGVPFGRIYGKSSFYGLDFTLSDETLEPRNDTETLIRVAESSFNAKRGHILDIGTGSGCLLVTLLSLFNDTHGTGIDISENALQTARHNAAANKVDDRCNFICTNWLSALSCPCDLIVSNPPYIESGVIPELDESVKNYDPIPALDGGKDGLDAYRKIFSQVRPFFRDDTIGLFEIGYDQSQKVMRLVMDSGLAVKDVHRDMAGRERVVEIFLPH